MRISDWSSDVCSSDLIDGNDAITLLREEARVPAGRPAVAEAALRPAMDDEGDRQLPGRVRGLEDHAPHLVAVRTGELDLFECHRIEFGKGRGIDVGELADLDPCIAD